MSRILIRNARLVNEGREFDADVLVAHGRIDTIGSLDHLSAEIEIDARGQWLLPGMIDDQVHFRDPGAPDKGSCTASRGPRWPVASPASWTCPTPRRRPWILPP